MNTHHTRTAEDTAPLRIAVHLPNWIGDTVLATPFLHALPLVFPGSEVVLFGQPHVADILLHFPGIARIEKLASAGKVAVTRNLAARLRRGSFDMGFLLTNSLRTALAFRLGGVRKRTGYALDMRGILLTHPLAASGPVMEQSMVEYYMNLLSPFTAMENLPRIMKLYPSPEECREAERLLREAGWDGSSRIVGINPFAWQWVTKRWFPERFAQVADRLSRQYNVQCVFNSVEKDRPLFEEIRSLCPLPLLDLVGRAPLNLVPALLARYSLFITNDSGLMHVAAAMDIPIVAVFGPTDYRRTAPYCRHAALIRHDTGHAPCMRPECRRNFQCMNSITVEDVCTAAGEFLSCRGG